MQFIESPGAACRREQPSLSGPRLSGPSASADARKTPATGTTASIETTFRKTARGIPVRRMRPKARRRRMTEEIAETVRETAESKAAITIPT